MFVSRILYSIAKQLKEWKELPIHGTEDTRIEEQQYFHWLDQSHVVLDVAQDYHGLHTKMKIFISPLKGLALELSVWKQALEDQVIASIDMYREHLGKRRRKDGRRKDQVLFECRVLENMRRYRSDIDIMIQERKALESLVYHVYSSARELVQDKTLDQVIQTLEETFEPRVSSSLSNHRRSWPWLLKMIMHPKKKEEDRVNSWWPIACASHAFHRHGLLSNIVESPSSGVNSSSVTVSHRLEQLKGHITSSSRPEELVPLLQMFLPCFQSYLCQLPPTSTPHWSDDECCQMWKTSASLAQDMKHLAQDIAPIIPAQHTLLMEEIQTCYYQVRTSVAAIVEILIESIERDMQEFLNTHLFNPSQVYLNDDPCIITEEYPGATTTTTTTTDDDHHETLDVAQKSRRPNVYILQMIDQVFQPWLTRLEHTNLCGSTPSSTLSHHMMNRCLILFSEKLLSSPFRLASEGVKQLDADVQHIKSWMEAQKTLGLGKKNQLLEELERILSGVEICKHTSLLHIMSTSPSLNSSTETTKSPQDAWSGVSDPQRWLAIVEHRPSQQRKGFSLRKASSFRVSVNW